MAITDYNTVPGSNATIGGLGALGSDNVENFDDVVRVIAADLAKMNSGDDPIHDTMVWADPATPTKRVRWDAGGISAGQTRVFSMPDFDLSVIDDDTMAAASSTTLATSESVVAYITSQIAGLANAMIYKDNWDASVGTFPGAGAAQTGWFYTVSIAGTVDSVDFAVGDRVIAVTDNASTATYAANWTKLDATDAVTAVVGLTGSVSKANLLTALNVEDGADVTDAGNVQAAGALMDSELTNEAAIKAINQSLVTTAKPTFAAVLETVYAITGTTPSISASNGGIQTWGLSGNSTPTDGLSNGDSVTLMIDDGTAYTVTWTSLVGQWIGGSAPTLATSGYTVVELWKVGGVVYGAYVGDAS